MVRFVWHQNKLSIMDETDFFDDLETRSPEEREAALFADLPGQLRHAQQHAPAYTEMLRDIVAEDIDHREALVTLPITRKSSLFELQRAKPSFGGFAALDVGEFARVFSSPGPIFEPQSRRDDFWRLARAMYAAGFRRGDLVHNTFAYHFTPAGFMVDSCAHALGCAVFPAGVGQTDLQVSAMVSLRPQAYAGTPSFLRVLLEKGKEVGADLSSLTKAWVSGGALPPSLRQDINSFGIDVLQTYATADLGLIAYESSAKEGLILDEEIIVEIVTPGTGTPVLDGQVGEVVVTTLNPDYPLIRFATADLSAIMDGVSPCGRTNFRIKGWMGRADQSTKVKGLFVHPSQVANVVERHREIAAARLLIESENNYDQMTLVCEVADVSMGGLSEQIAVSMREVCKLRCEVRLIALGSLDNDGKVIDDRRSYQ